MTLCDPMNCSMPGPPVHHQLPEFTQTHSCPLSLWCHPSISFSVIPFFSCLQSFPASGSFQMSQLFASGDQSIGVSASTSVPPMNTQDWSLRIDWLDLLAVQGTLKSLLQHHSSKASFLHCTASLQSNYHIHTWTTGKTRALTWQTFVGKVMSLLFQYAFNVGLNFPAKE